MACWIGLRVARPTAPRHDGFRATRAFRCVKALLATFAAAVAAFGCGARVTGPGVPQDAGVDTPSESGLLVGQDCGVGLPAAEAEPFTKSCNFGNCDFGIVPTCCGSYAVAFTSGQDGSFDSWASAWTKCQQAACEGVRCAGGVVGFESGDYAFGTDGSAPVGVVCTGLTAPKCVTYLREIPLAPPSQGVCDRYFGASPGLVCFGSDPAPYQKYLIQRDGGPTPGQCPTSLDFVRVTGEGSCGMSGCGPLLPSAVDGLAGAAAQTADAGNACCFWVIRVCGV
jgi:hypothetical protein